MRDIIQLFGQYGSGKGTQAQILELTGLFKQISTGDLFDKIKREMNPRDLAIEMKRLDLEGKLYSDKLAIDSFRYELERTDKIPIADGIPRTKEQVYLLNEFTNTRFIFFLNVPDDICNERMKIRAQYDEKKQFDKNPKAREGRLKVYHEKTEPLLELYDKYKIVNIDGTQDIQSISKQILDILYYSKFIN